MTASTNPGPKDAAIPAISNALINGAIAHTGHSDRAAVPLTVDAISSTEATVGSEVAMIALALAVVLTVITALIARKRLERQRGGRAARPFFLTVALVPCRTP